MAELSITMPTYLELSKRMTPDLADIAAIVELLGKQHGLWSKLRWQEGNLPTGEQTTVRNGLPTVYWRLFNRGTPDSSSQTSQLTFQAGKIESFSTIDEELLKISPNAARFRLTEAVAHLEAIAQEFSSTAFYGTAASPEEFVGLASMYSDPTANNGQNVLDAGGTDGSDNTSIWLINTGPDVYGIYPRGTTAGINRVDMGVQLIENLGGTGRKGRAAVEQFTLGCGMVVRDWRRIVRIGSIDVSNLVAQTNDANLTYWMTKACERVRWNAMGGETFFVANRTVIEYLNHQRQDRYLVGGGITRETVDGDPRLSFNGFPIVCDDNILNTEAPV